MTNKERWIIERMKILSSFHKKLEEIEIWVPETREQRDAMQTLYISIDELVSADAQAIGRAIGAIDDD